MTASPPDISIDAAVLADVDTLVDLWVTLAREQRAYHSHLEPEGNRTQVRAALAHHIVGDGVFLARVETDGNESGDVVGFVMFGLEQGSYEQTVSRGIVHNLFVVSGYRGRGIGSALLDRAEQRLVAFGADVFSLEAMATNERARRFYERHGYCTHRVELEKSAQSDTHSKEDG